MLKNGQLDEGILVLVNDLVYWQYDRLEIEYEIRAIPFRTTLIEVSTQDAQCQCTTNSCYFTETDDLYDELDNAKKNTKKQYHDFNSELYAVGIIFLILFLVIILSNGILAIHRRLKNKRVVPMITVRPCG